MIATDPQPHSGNRRGSNEMRFADRQTTLRSQVALHGVGMHSGAFCSATVRPAAGNAGIVFRSGEVVVPATTEFVVGTERCTSLGRDGVRVSTVEHLLSALHGMGVDNVDIEIAGPEIPILDGSAKPWVEAFQGVGLSVLDEYRAVARIEAPVAMRDDDAWYVAIPSEVFSVTCVVSYDHPLIGTKAVSFCEDDEEDHRAYATCIAPARTYGFAEEVEYLIEKGLARGGSLDNALILYDDRYSSALRLPDECVRHKTLDLIGDLALMGVRLRAAITAVKPGHRANTRFASLLAARAVRGTGSRPPKENLHA